MPLSRRTLPGFHGHLCTRLAGATGVMLCVGLMPAQAMDSLTITVPDAPEAVTEAVRGASLLAAAERDGLRDPLEIFSVARAEYGRLIGVMYARGYYSPVISVRLDGREAADMSPLSPPPSVSAVTVQITPGPVFTFGQADIGPLAPGTTPAGNEFVSGAPARSTVVRDAAQAAVSDWRDIGHAKAEPTGQDITADHARARLDVDVRITPGPRLNFGALIPDGQERTRPARIVEIAGLPSGAVFAPADLDRAAERLRRTGTFASVALREAETPNPDGSLDINATLVEAQPRRIGAGAEIDSVDGVRLSAFWLHRNLLGGAERFRVEGEVGGIGAQVGGLDYRLGLDFSRPATFTPDTSLTFGAVLESVDERNYEAERASVQAGLSHIFSENLTGTAGLSYQYERARFGPNRATRRNFATIALPVTAEWDRRDDAQDPTSGFFVSGGVTPYIGLQGTDSGVQTKLDARSYVAFGADQRFVLAGRAQIGAVFGADLAATPRGYLFHSGGGGTVRGQPFESLGVTSGGVTSGGQGFAALSAEMRAGITETIGVVAFADAGYVSENALGGTSDWHAGAGLGLRYKTSIGPIRLDLGMPVRGATGDGLQVYIGIGQAF
ncbi:autotransporter assembly complex protein TamA [Roseicitreum antarcticum]|uniref:autotransporter assembly complex protein TamA n=1 Tax=Roseicitreum antarcticum TaxID=564137 RepID=UPI0015A1E2BC|nr:BamA/TamA family outer membrane protein [Roseicitreum antarcticum]